MVNFNFIIAIFVLAKIEIIRVSGILTEPVDYEKKFGQVIHVSAVFRHGNRAPDCTYPRDPYRHYTWPPDGFGKLTLKGKRRAYELGKWFRNRYENLMEQISSFGNITVQSSAMDRTIMSAESVLAAFYPPNSNQTIEKGLAWQPVPIFSIPNEYDNMIRVVGSTDEMCPRVVQLINEHYSSEKMRKKYDKHARIIRYLKRHSGYELPKENMRRMTDRINNIYDVLFIQREHGFKLPRWSKKVFPRKLHSLKTDFDTSEGRVYKIQRLYTGPFFKSLTTEMSRKISGSSKQLFNFYSGHDSTIIIIMMALGVFDNISPPYSATLMFELRQKLNEKIVTVFYSNSTSTSPHFIEIPNCKSPCTFENFLKLTDLLIPTDWEKECRVEKI